MNKPIKIITACAACAAAIGLGTFAVLINKDKKAVPTYSDTEETTAATEATTASLAELGDKYGYVPSQLGMTERAKSLLHINKDVIGWIKIDSTQVDYPVFLDPGAISKDNGYYGGEEYYENYFYLDHDMNRGFDRDGSLFMDYRDVFGSNEKEQSENLVIYGHNMANGVMFGSIRRYRQDYDFYKASPFVKLSSNYKDYDYVIFAFLITSGSFNATDFHYWDMEELDSEEDFNFYIDCCKRSQMIDTGVDVKYGDKLLTLSTCYADEDNSRFIIVARRLRDGEVAGDLNSIQHTEAYIQAQKEEAERAQKEKEEAEKASKAAEEQPQQ